MADIFDVPLERLRERRSEKWREYDPDVLPLWVAESDVELAGPIREVLLAAVRSSDTGYPRVDGQLPAALAAYAASNWDWGIDPAQVHPVADVGIGVMEMLRANVEPGDRVVVCSPVYPPFYIWIEQVRGEVVDVPLVLVPDDAGTETWRLDLEGLRRAFAAGARAMILCNPANPVGRAWTAGELAAAAELAAEHGVLVVSDEIHAPVVLAGARFTPYLSVSDAARETGVSVLAASKGWNTAGLKCAQIVSASETMHRAVRRIHWHRFHEGGHFGMLASIAAYAECGDWMQRAVAELSVRRDELAELVAEHLPEARYVRPEATYLAWLDLNAYGWGDNPAHRILKEARVALNRGTEFGPVTGAGCVRINFGTSRAILTEAFERISTLLHT